MTFCDYCGEEIVTTPYRRRGHSYCSRTCAEEHEFETPKTDDEIEEFDTPEEERELM
jgi:hypothetical protein